MNSDTAAIELGDFLTTAREALGISARELARRSGIHFSNVRRIELGEVSVPNPDTLRQLADALGLDLADLFAIAGYSQPQNLPAFTPYLRSKYRDLPPDAQDELAKAFEHITDKYGYDPSTNGPRAGEDEQH